MTNLDKPMVRIAKIFDKNEPPEVSEGALKKYLGYLKKNLELPCNLTGIEDFEWEEFYIIGPGSKKEHEELRKTQASYLDTFELVGFEGEIDVEYGIFVNVRRLSDKKDFLLPLADLKAMGKKSKNYQLLDDYSVWFVNFR